MGHINNETEIWVDIPDYEGIYQASNMGRIKSLSRTVTSSTCVRQLKEKILKQSISNVPYYHLVLYRNKMPHTFLVHRLIAQVFLETWDSQREVNHINGNKLDNRLCNLEMCSRLENNQHSISTGLWRNYGENNINSKLSKEEVWQIKLLYHIWGLKQWQLSASFGITQQNVSKVINNKTYFR